ncbi:hypothetical protein UJ101_02385 [Flavobacteriaceae bacterium UJ101]|nr:hypothetical protein UJ101_02385 [Flavobacteriaceae bacterium UJ101]
MKTSYLYIILFLFSCSQDSEEIIQETQNLVEQTAQEALDIRISNSINQNRVDIINRTIITTVPEDYSKATAQRTNFSATSTSIPYESSEANITNNQDHYWFWVAKINSPILETETLSATHIAIKNTRAYVSYHKQGTKHLGMLEVVDISNPNQPQLLTQIDFLEADINAVHADDNNQTVWLAASHKKHGATVYKIDITATISTESIDRINLSNLMDNGISASANGISTTQNHVIISAGKTFGGTFILDKTTLDGIYYDSYSNGKYVAVNNSTDEAYYAALTTGDIASVKIGQLSDLSTPNEFQIGNITHENVKETYKGKNTLYFANYNSDLIYVSTGKNGVKVYDIFTNQLVNESKGTMLVAGNSNAVTMDDDYIYIANGADGISITDFPNSGDRIDPLFNWDMQEQPASANYITSEGDWIFVAKGQGGFNILRKQTKEGYMTIAPYNQSGTPETIENNEVCNALLPKIFSEILPERTNAIKAHPEYFENPSKNLYIKEKTEISVTFLNEGAGYKNILGYYAYDENNPPNSVDDLIKIVIFPNASAKNSGGELIKGNSMKLLGEFEAGTVIGFFLISNGWKGKITDGKYTQYTHIPFNPSQKQQSIIFHESECNATVIAFEDIKVPDGDNDFNDAIFQISTSNPNAIDTSEYITFE